MPLSKEHQKIFDDWQQEMRELTLKEVPKPGEVWSGNASWKRHQKAEIISYDESYFRVSWKSLETNKTWISYLRDFKSMFSSPKEWELSDKMCETMEEWRKTSN